jgi:hypothetical protein
MNDNLDWQDGLFEPKELEDLVQLRAEVQSGALSEWDDEPDRDAMASRRPSLC